MQLKKKNRFYLLVYRLKIKLVYLKAYFFSASFLIFIKPFLKKSGFGEEKNILVVQTEKLGDIVLSLTFLYNISESEKDCEKFLLIDEKYLSGLFSDNFPFKLIPINKSKYRFDFFYRIKFINNLRKLRLKHLINISQGRGVINDELSINSGSRFSSCVNVLSDYLPDRLLKKNVTGYNFVLESKSQNEFIRLQELFKYISKHDYKTTSVIQSLLHMTKPRITLAENYIVIAPSTSEEKKNWTKENFKALSAKISNQYPVYLLGTSSQSEYLSFISDGVENVNNLAGSVSLAECIYLIKHCSLFIGLDSGFTHIAEFFSKPYIAIIGGGEFGRFFPYPSANADKYKFHELPCFNCKWNCIYTEAYCLNLITVDNIYNSCISLMRTN
jgi:ADP-heptose:LPS heptosyltransferase